MKKLLAVLVITFALSLASHADYYTGAWFTTRAAIPAEREAGMCEVSFYAGNVVQIDFYHDGEYDFTATGTYVTKPTGTTFTAYFKSPGFFGTTLWFKGVYKKGLLSGSYSGTYQGTKKVAGKFQATRIVEE